MPHHRAELPFAPGRSDVAGDARWRHTFRVPLRPDPSPTSGGASCPSPTATRTPPAAVPRYDFGEELADFSDTAGSLANLGLLVTMDSAMAHLGGAIGAPVCSYMAANNAAAKRAVRPSVAGGVA